MYLYIQAKKACCVSYHPHFSFSFWQSDSVTHLLLAKAPRWVKAC